jgi:hypothetical protein
MTNCPPFKGPRRRSIPYSATPLKALAVELERHPVVGPGPVHRLAAELQRRYVIAPERGTSGAEPREQLARQVWR